MDFHPQRAKVGKKKINLIHSEVSKKKNEKPPQGVELNLEMKAPLRFLKENAKK